jgi:hypothetical protein
MNLRVHLLSCVAILKNTETAPVSFVTWPLKSNFMHFLDENHVQIGCHKENTMLCFLIAIFL